MKSLGALPDCTVFRVAYIAPSIFYPWFPLKVLVFIFHAFCHISWSSVENYGITCINWKAFRYWWSFNFGEFSSESCSNTWPKYETPVGFFIFTVLNFDIQSRFTISNVNNTNKLTIRLRLSRFRQLSTLWILEDVSHILVVEYQGSALGFRGKSNEMMFLIYQEHITILSPQFSQL